MKRWRKIALGSLAVVVCGGVLVGKLMLGGCRSTDTRIAERSIYGGAKMSAAAEDWPRYRGPRGDGISREKLPAQLPAGRPKQLWSAEVGLGYSSPIAANGRLYLFTLDSRQEALTAFDANTGRILWTRHLETGWSKDYPGTRATPTIDGDRIYTFGGTGELACRRLGDGELVWRMNVLKETGAGNLRWGVASSPLVSDGRVYVQGGRDSGSIALAVDARNGKVAWTSDAKGTSGYAPCVVADVEGQRQLIVFGGEEVVAMEPASGRTLWTVPWRTSYEINAAAPVCRDGHIFITSSYRHGCMMLKASASGVQKLWEHKTVFSKFQPPILDGDVLFANSEGTVKCLTWPGGEVKWASPRSDLGGGGSMIRVGDNLLMMGERGRLILAHATADSFERQYEAEILDDTEIWSTPLLYGGRLYVKGTREIACLALE